MSTVHIHGLGHGWSEGLVPGKGWSWSAVGANSNMEATGVRCDEVGSPFIAMDQFGHSLDLRPTKSEKEEAAPNLRT